MRSIPWIRLVAEGAAIVVSILLAFVIDAAWDVRGELQEEREMLEGLRAEFEDVRRRLDTWVDFNRAQAPPAYGALLGDRPFRAFLSLQRGLHRLVARDQERASTTAAALIRAIDEYLGR